MTEFQRRVATNLQQLIEDYEAHHKPTSTDETTALAEWLAPNVAAAIDADRWGEPDEIARQRGAALQKLRGA